MKNDEIAVTFAKIAGLYKALKTYCDQPNRVGVPTHQGDEYFDRFIPLVKDLRQQVPLLYSDLLIRNKPIPSKVADYNTRIYGKDQLEVLLRDMEYIFEVRANSELEVPTKEARPQKVFVSHGRSQDWREVQSYIEKDLQFPTMELAQEPSRGRTVLQKLSEESDACSFAVVVMTGDDAIGTDAPRVRENVMHEIGFFQGKYGLANVCLLHEEGVSIPTNIHGVVYIPFPKGLVSASFGTLMREIRAAFAS